MRNVPPAWVQPLAGFEEHLRAGKKAETTIRLRRQHLTQLAAVHPDPWAVTERDLLAWVGSRDWKRATASSVRSTLRTFYEWGQRARLTADDPARALPSISQRKPTPHPLGDDVLATVLAKATERERLILHLAGRVGMRRGEIARCRGEHVHGDDGSWSIVIVGKGERPRVVPISDDLAHAVRARGQGWTFPGNDHGHLSPDWVGSMISRLMPAGWSLHSLRHRFATRAYAATRDVYSVQALLGHASPATTLIYVRIPDDAMRAAMLAAS